MLHNRNNTCNAVRGVRLLRGVIVALGLAGAMAMPAYAESNDGKEGYVTIYTATGGVIHKDINDSALLAELLKNSMAIPEGGLVMMHGGKWYLVQNHKMADGSMVVDSISRK